MTESRRLWIFLTAYPNDLKDPSFIPGGNVDQWDDCFRLRDFEKLRPAVIDSIKFASSWFHRTSNGTCLVLEGASIDDQPLDLYTIEDCRVDSGNDKSFTTSSSQMRHPSTHLSVAAKKRLGLLSDG